MNTEGPSKSSRYMLVTLNLLASQGKIHLFEGVPARVKAKRRAKGKAARIARRHNRG